MGAAVAALLTLPYEILKLKPMADTKTKVERIKFKTLAWTDIVNPDSEVLEELRKKHKFHELDLEDCLSENQRSKIDEYDKYLFLVLHFPHFDKKKKALITEEVNIFIGQNYLITLHNGVLPPLLRIFEKCRTSMREKKKYLGQGTGYFLYEIIDAMLDDGFPMLDYLGKNVTTVEKSVFGSETEQHDMLKDILVLKKDIITFRRLVAPQRTVIAQLEHKNKKFLPDDLEVYFDDLVDKVEKIWSNLDSMKDLVISLQETNESIISHTTNNIIKVLTIFSVVMLPLTFLTGLYGMNVGLPYDTHPMAFAGIAGAMVAVVLLMLVFFKFKRWL